MAQQISTIGKFSTSHDRMTLTFKFGNGENLRINSSRYRSSLSVKAPSGVKSYGSGALQTILTAADTNITGENNGERFERIKALGEKMGTIAEFATALKA